MSNANRNFIIAYILLVALPIVGLAGVLKSGRTLTAPISVDGTWRLQADPVLLAALPCGKTLGENPETALAISQSGRNFTVSLASGPKSTASGIVDGATIKASFAPAAEWSAAKGCGTGRELSLVATVDTKSDPRSLSGVLSVNDCASCGPVAFRAVRLAPAAKKGLH
jgi:hypothetical protein